MTIKVEWRTEILQFETPDFLGMEFQLYDDYRSEYERKLTPDSEFEYLFVEHSAMFAQLAEMAKTDRAFTSLDRDGRVVGSNISPTRVEEYAQLLRNMDLFGANLYCTRKDGEFRLEIYPRYWRDDYITKTIVYSTTTLSPVLPKLDGLQSGRISTDTPPYKQLAPNWYISARRRYSVSDGN